MKFAYKVHFRHGVYTSDLFNSKKECHKAAEKLLKDKPTVGSYGIVGVRYVKRKNKETKKLETVEDWCFYREYSMMRDPVFLELERRKKSVRVKGRGGRSSRRYRPPKRRQARPS